MYAEQIEKALCFGIVAKEALFLLKTSTCAWGGAEICTPNRLEKALRFGRPAKEFADGCCQGSWQ